MEYRLEELFDLQMGKTPSRSVTEYWESGNNKWISIADLSKCGKYIYDTKECLSDIAVSESGIKQIPANTVVMSFKLSIGKTAITSEPMYSNEAIMSFRDRKLVQLLPEYIYYLLLSKNWDDGTNKAVMGKTLNKATLSKVKVNIHSMQEQQELVYVLNQATALIELHQQQLQKLDDLVKARFVEMFGNPVVNNKGWNVSDLGQLTIKIGSGATPKGGKEAYQTDGISLIRSMNVHNGKFEYKELAHISDEQAARLENVAVEENDVLLNITGASVARSCVVPTNVLPARVNQHVCIIRCKDSIMPDFINSLLIDDNYQDLLWSIAGSGATREAITKQQVESLQIILPPISKQEEFSKFINRVDKSKVAVQKSLDEAQLLFDSLMQQYFG